MIACSFIASHRCVKNALGFLLAFLLLLFPFVALAHPLSQAAKQARPLVSAPSKHTPQPKSVSQLKVGDVIRARNHATGKVEWKQVTHASKRTVPSLLSVQLADTRTGRPAETLVCPLDQPVRLIDGSAIPAGHLAIGKSIVTRAGPVCKVKAMFLLRKPGGFVLCDVRIGSLSAANAKLLALSQERQKQSSASFADYKVPASRMAYATPNSSGGGTFNPFLFQGQQYDPASGDYYLRARYYDPTIGRFLSQDPFAGVDTDPASLHRYLYASNDPVNKIDPSGLDDLGQLEAGLEVTGELAPTEIQASGLNTLASLNATFGAAYGYAGTATPLIFSNLGRVALQRAALVVSGGLLASIIGSDFAGSPNATEQVYDGTNSKGHPVAGWHYSVLPPEQFTGTGLRAPSYFTNDDDLSPQQARSILLGGAKGSGPLQYRYTVVMSDSDPLYPIQFNPSPLGISSLGPVYEWFLRNGSPPGSITEVATYNYQTYQWEAKPFP